MLRIIGITALLLLVGCSGRAPHQAIGDGASSAAPPTVSASEVIPDPARAPANQTQASAATAQDSWYGVIGDLASQGGSMPLHLDRERGADNEFESEVQAPEPDGSNFAFLGTETSRAWPAGSPLAGGISLQFRTATVQDLSILLVANYTQGTALTPGDFGESGGTVVARSVYTGPTLHALEAPMVFALPRQTTERIPQGSTLTLVAHVSGTVNMVIYATSDNPTSVVIG